MMSVRDRRVRDAVAHAVEDAEEALGAVGAAHGAQDAVGAGLQRHVQLRHDVRRLGHRVDHVVGEGGRVRAREADALEAVDLAGGAQQLAEGETVAEFDAVGVDVLTEERHLDRAVGDERLDLGEDLAGSTVLLLAAQRRARCRRCRCCCSRPRSRPSPNRSTRDGWEGSRGRSRAIRGSRAGLRRCGERARGGPEASPCCACRRPRRPRGRARG